jgi:ankyrin repeat protein
LDADHRSICKFGSATDDDYIQVSRGIVRLVNEATDDFSKRQRQATGSDLLQPQGTSVPPTALHDACSEGDLGKISSLLEASADINARDSREFTPLMIACERDDLGVVGFLLSKGADPKRDSSLFKSPISLAIDNGNTEMVTLLFDNGVPIDQRTRMRMSLVEVQITPLGQAAGKGHASLVELILQRNPGPDVNAKLGVLGWTSLHHAVNGGHEAVVRLLLQYNARIDITDVKGHTPLDPMGTRARMRKKGQDLTRVSNLIENWRSEGMYSESAALLVQRPNTFWKAADEAMIQHTLADAGFVPIVRAGVNPNPQSTRSQPTSVSSNTSNWQPGPGPSRSPPSSQPAFGLPSLPPRPNAAYPQTPGERPPYAVERPINRPGATDPVPPAATTNIPTRRREVNEPGRFGRFVARLTR